MPEKVALTELETEMLDALQNLVGLIDTCVAVYSAQQIKWLQDGPSYEKAVQVIRKAKGEK